MSYAKRDRSFEITCSVLGTVQGTSAKGNDWFMLRTTAGTFFPEMAVVKETGLRQIEDGQRIGIVGEYEGEQVNFKTKQNEAKLVIVDIFIVPGEVGLVGAAHTNGVAVN
jgi:hypothetical protein